MPPSEHVKLLEVIIDNPLKFATHVHALRILYRDCKSTFEELLERDNTKTTHTINLQKLMIEVHKSLNHLNPEYMWEFFTKKDVQYTLLT